MNKYLIRIFLLFLSFSFCTVLPAQKTMITGFAPGAERKVITLRTATDLLTMTDDYLCRSRVDSTGHFELSTELSETKLVTLAIDFHDAELFLEPGRKYSLEIAPMRYDDYTEINPFIQSQDLTVEFKGTDGDELNRQIGLFNAFYSAFLMENFNALYRDRNKTVLDTFRIMLNKEFGSNRNSYFLNYALYKFAALEQLTKYHSVPQLGKKYFTDKPILYYNVEYMEFFNSFFTKYLSAGSSMLRKVDFKPILKQPDAYTIMMKRMAADTMLKPVQLRELVLLKSLSEFYSAPDYSREHVLSLIDHIRNTSDFAEHRLIASHLARQLTRLAPGTPAPDFTLPDKNQAPVSLQSLRGKPIVLNFWTTYCEGCLSEMDLIRPMYDKFGSQVHFVSISADKYFTKMLYFINNKPDFTWTFLSTGEQSEILKEYDVRSYPLFILIDEKGDIYKYPAQLPSRGLESDLINLIVK